MLAINTTPRLYIACLASYNNGVLYGEWIDASSDADEMRDEVARILRGSKFPNVTVECPDCDGAGLTYDNPKPEACQRCAKCKGSGEVPSAEEFAIHDHEGVGNIGEYTSLDTVADYVALLEEFDHIDAGDLAAILDDYSTPDEARDALNDGFCGIYDTFKDYSDEYVDDCIMPNEDSESTLARYFDYDAFARDLRHNMRVIDVPGGVAVFHA